MLEEEIYGENSPIWDADFTMPAAEGAQLGHQTGEAEDTGPSSATFRPLKMVSLAWLLTCSVSVLFHFLAFSMYVSPCMCLCPFLVLSPGAVSGSPSFTKNVSSGASSLGSMGLDAAVSEPITGMHSHT